MKKQLGVFLTAIFPFAVSASQTGELVSPEPSTEFVKKKAVTAHHYMVAAANPLAVEAGYKMLRKGGSAIDAMIAVQTVLGLVEPQSSGLGGGAFVVYYNAKTKKITTFNGRETAPMEVTPELFQDKNGKPLKFYDAVVGGRSVGTPGTVKLMGELYNRYGKLNRITVLKPAAKLATNGFRVSNRLAVLIKSEKPNRLTRYPETRDYFYHKDGSPLKEGELLKNPKYARTLTTLAHNGFDAFYKGSIAKNIVAKVRGAKDNPGVLSLQDFFSYKVEEREAVCSPYHQYKVCGMGPPSSGELTVGQILGIVSHFDLKTLGANNPKSWQIIGDATRLAFSDRNRYMADDHFVPMPEGLLDRDYLAKRARLITKGYALKKVEAGHPRWKNSVVRADDDSIEFPSTSHISIVDGEGNIISMTTTIEQGFGSRMMVDGFLLNNELTDFSFSSYRDGWPVANRVEPRKRPRSSMSPTIVFKDQKPYMSIGSPGGSRIISYVTNALIRNLEWNIPIQDALNLPHLQNRSGVYELEENTSAISMASALKHMGYKVSVRPLTSGIQAILFKDGKLIGAADPRREGIAMGN